MRFTLMLLETVRRDVIASIGISFKVAKVLPFFGARFAQFDRHHRQISQVGDGLSLSSMRRCSCFSIDLLRRSGLRS